SHAIYSNCTWLYNTCTTLAWWYVPSFLFCYEWARAADCRWFKHETTPEERRIPGIPVDAVPGRAERQPVQDHRFAPRGAHRRVRGIVLPDARGSRVRRAVSVVLGIFGAPGGPIVEAQRDGIGEGVRDRGDDVRAGGIFLEPDRVDAGGVVSDGRALDAVQSR